MERETAREILLRHSHSPRNGALPEDYTHAKKLKNPICGDEVELRFTVTDGKILKLGFAAKGCAVCAAATSLMCEIIDEQTPRSARDLASAFENALLDSVREDWPAALACLRSLSHLRVNPARRACAVLPWIVLRSGLASLHDVSGLPINPETR